jgi:hypothetical protein
MRIEFAACEAMRWRHAMSTMVRFAATGKQIRSLPLNDQDLSGGA